MTINNFFIKNLFPNLQKEYSLLPICLSTGLWIFLSPMQDLPRIPIGSFYLRIGYIGLLFIIPILFLNYKKYWDIVKAEPLFLLCGLIVLYNIFLLIHHADLRAIGFLVWLIFNCIFLLISSQISFNIFFKLILYSQIINSLYIILSNYFHSHMILPANYDYYNFLGHVRSYAFLGEPSYVSLLFFPTIILSNYYLSFKKRIFTNLLLISAFSFTYSRTSLLCLSILPILLLFPKASRANYIKAFIIPLLASIIISAIDNPIFWGYENRTQVIIAQETPSLIQTMHTNPTLPSPTQFSETLNSGSTSTRIAAFQKGWAIVKNNFLFGVGLGNSKSYISKQNPNIKNKLHKTGVHNLFLEIIVEQGIIGLVLFLLLLGRVFQLHLKHGWKPTATALLFLIFVPMQLCQNINMPAMWIFLALAYAEVSQRRKMPETPTIQRT